MWSFCQLSIHFLIEDMPHHDSIFDYISAMKSMILMLSALLFQLVEAQGQSSKADISLEVQWPLDTHLRITVSQWSEERNETTFVPEDSSQYTFDIKVVGHTSNDIEIELTVDDPLYTSSSQWIGDWAGENTLQKQITILCSVNKQTAKISIPNWQELSKRILERNDRTRTILAAKDGEMASYLNLIFDQYDKSLATEEGIIGLYANDLQLLVKPYGHSYQQEIALTIETEAENPFNKDETIQTTEKLTLLQNNDPLHYTIDYRIEYDMEKLLAMMREMFLKLNAALASNSKSAEAKQKEFDSIKMSMTHLSTYTIVAANGIPKDYVFTIELDGFDGKKNRTTRKQTHYQIDSIH
jgi:hypothetical protein